MESIATSEQTTGPRRADGAAPKGLADQLRAAWNGEERGSVALAAVCVGLLVLLYWPALVHLVWTWSRDENYGHGFLVPLISLYFANEVAQRTKEAAQPKGWVCGIVLLATAVLGRILTTMVPIGVIGDLSFVAGLAGILGLVAGTRTLKQYRFPLFFLVFMIPLPIALYTLIATPLQRLVSLTASGILTLIGIPVLCQGNMMTLPGDIQLFVAEACSGMRQLTGFLALATAVAWLLPRPAWYRVILIASSIPIALAANVLRVTLTAWVAYRFNPELASGWYHTVEGLLMMGVGLGMIAAECALLDRVAMPGRGERVPVPHFAS